MPSCNEILQDAGWNFLCADAVRSIELCPKQSQSVETTTAESVVQQACSLDEFTTDLVDSVIMNALGSLTCIPQRQHPGSESNDADMTDLASVVATAVDAVLAIVVVWTSHSFWRKGK